MNEVLFATKQRSFLMYQTKLIFTINNRYHTYTANEKGLHGTRTLCKAITHNPSWPFRPNRIHFLPIVYISSLPRQEKSCTLPYKYAYNSPWSFNLLACFPSISPVGGIWFLNLFSRMTVLRRLKVKKKPETFSFPLVDSRRKGDFSHQKNQNSIWHCSSF